MNCTSKQVFRTAGEMVFSTQALQTFTYDMYVRQEHPVTIDLSPSEYQALVLNMVESSARVESYVWCNGELAGVVVMAKAPDIHSGEAAFPVCCVVLDKFEGSLAVGREMLRSMSDAARYLGVDYFYTAKHTGNRQTFKLHHTR